MLEVEPPGHCSRMTTRSDQNVPEADKLTSLISRKPSERAVIKLTTKLNNKSQAAAVVGRRLIAGKARNGHRRGPISLVTMHVLMIDSVIESRDVCHHQHAVDLMLYNAVKPSALSDLSFGARSAVRMQSLQDGDIVTKDSLVIISHISCRDYIRVKTQGHT